MPTEWIDLLIDPFTTFLGRVALKLPGVVGALILLLIGIALGRFLRRIVDKILAMSRLDELLGRVGFSEVLSRVGFGRSVSYAIGFLVYWLIIMVFLVSAANAINLTVVSELLNRFVLFMPRLIASVVVVIGGMVLAHFVGEVVRNACEANRVQGSSVISRIFKIVVVIFASIMGLDQLGINTGILTSSVQIILATVGLTLAIAFGLGGKDVAAGIIRDFMKGQKG